MSMEKSRKERFDDLISDTCFENFKVPATKDFYGKHSPEKNTGDYWELGEVLYCKAHWILELLKDIERSGIEDVSMHITAIQDIQEFITIFNDDRIAEVADEACLRP